MSIDVQSRFCFVSVFYCNNSVCVCVIWLVCDLSSACDADRSLMIWPVLGQESPIVTDDHMRGSPAILTSIKTSSWRPKRLIETRYCSDIDTVLVGELCISVIISCWGSFASVSSSVVGGALHRHHHQLFSPTVAVRRGRKFVGFCLRSSGREFYHFCIRLMLKSLINDLIIHHKPGAQYGLLGPVIYDIFRLTARHFRTINNMQLYAVKS